MWPFRTTVKKQDSEQSSNDAYNEESDYRHERELNRCLILKMLLPSHHYAFIHQIMREYCQTFPDAYFIKMSSEQTEFVHELWEITCKSCDKPVDAYFSPKDIDFHLIRINDYPTVLTVMPPPIIQNDAYYAAAVLLDGDKLTVKSKQTVAYITLERAIGRFGIETNLLCAWNGSVHINFGINLNTLEPSEFVEAVEILLRAHMDKLIGESEAKKWSDYHSDIKRSFASTGLQGNA